MNPASFMLLARETERKPFGAGVVSNPQEADQTMARPASWRSPACDSLR